MSDNHFIDRIITLQIKGHAVCMYMDECMHQFIRILFSHACVATYLSCKGSECLIDVAISKKSFCTQGWHFPTQLTDFVFVHSLLKPA